jgi:hypothetical protein
LAQSATTSWARQLLWEDAPVKPLDREPAGGVAVDERVEAPAEPVDLDDVADLDAFDPHPSTGYEPVCLPRATCLV